MKNLQNILPFLNDENIAELAMSVLSGEVDLPLITVLPFLKEADVDKLIDQITENPTAYPNINFEDFLPFASDKAVDKIFLTSVKSGEIQTSVLPLVSDECLHQTVLHYIEHPDWDWDLDALYPFLNDADISLLFKALIKNRKKQQ